jgi:hypothetical protein
MSWGATINDRPPGAITQNGWWTADGWQNFYCFYGTSWIGSSLPYSTSLFFNQQTLEIYDSDFFYIISYAPDNWEAMVPYYFYFNPNSMDPYFVYNSTIKCYTSNPNNPNPNVTNPTFPITYVFDSTLTTTNINPWIGPLIYNPPSSYVWDTLKGTFTDTVTNLEYDSDYKLITVLITPIPITINTLDLGTSNSVIEQIISTELSNNYNSANQTIQAEFNNVQNFLFKINHWITSRDESEIKRTHMVMSILAHLCPSVDSSYMYLFNKCSSWINKYVKQANIQNAIDITKSILRVPIRKGTSVQERLEGIFTKIKISAYLQTGPDSSEPSKLNFLECFN